VRPQAKGNMSPSVPLLVLVADTDTFAGRGRVFPRHHSKRLPSSVIASRYALGTCR